jgi:hypothetical protein
MFRGIRMGKVERSDSEFLVQSPVPGGAGFSPDTFSH